MLCIVRVRVFPCLGFQSTVQLNVTLASQFRPPTPENQRFMACDLLRAEQKQENELLWLQEQLEKLAENAATWDNSGHLDFHILL